MLPCRQTSVLHGSVRAAVSATGNGRGWRPLMQRDLNYGFKDFYKQRLRIRNARKPSVLEIMVLGLQSNSIPVSSARVPSKEERRGLER
jgi:hypothetical protein